MAGELVGEGPGRRGSWPDRLRALVDERRDSWLQSAALVPAVAGIVAFSFIAPTVMRSVAAWDTAEFQTVGPVLGTAHPTGFPSYVILGWLASIVLMPFGDPAFRMDLLQAILAAVAVAGTTGIVSQLTGNRLVALATGLTLGSTLLFWRLSTHADPHMFHVALLAALFVLLLGWERRRRSDDAALAAHADRWLVAAAIVYGVAVANHSLALLLAPAIGLFVLAVEPGILVRPRLILLCGGALAITIVGFFLELPVRSLMHAPLVYAKPDTWQGFWYVVLAEQFTGSLVSPWSDLASKAIKVGSILNQDLGAYVFLLLLGFAAAVARRAAVAFLAGLASLLAIWLVSPHYFGAGSSFDLTPYCIPLGFAAVATLRPRYALLSGTAVVVTLWFAASYQNADIERYYLGPLLIIFTWIGLGVAEAVAVVTEMGGTSWWPSSSGRGSVRAWLARSALPYDLQPRPGAAASSASPRTPAPGARAGSPSRLPFAMDARQLAAALTLAAAAAMVAPLPGTAIERYAPSWDPGGANESALHSDADWMNQVMSGLPKDSVVISWWSRSTTLWYGQKALGLRPDIFIADDRTRIDMGIGQDVQTGITYFQKQKRPIFLIRYGRDEIDQLSQQYKLKGWFDDSVWQVLGPREGS